MALLPKGSTIEIFKGERDYTLIVPMICGMDLRNYGTDLNEVAASILSYIKEYRLITNVKIV